MAFKFNYSESTLSRGLDTMSTKAGAAVLLYMSTKAVELEAQMKRNRPWTDRTGMAKATLNAKVSRPRNDVVRITLAHGVSYGVDLEMKHGKQYAIVGPTVRQEGPRLISGLSGLMSKLT